MTGEIIEGKRTLIERDGREFELPFRHEVELTNGDEQSRFVHLRAGVQGSTYRLGDVEQHEDRVIVHLGDWIGHHGPPGKDAVVGYPFPS
jgi:hypothetical protein